MPQHCIKCGSALTCGKCQAAMHVGATAVTCTLKKKGALWVHVLDHEGNSVPKMQVVFEGNRVETNDDGLAVFDPLTAKKGYRIALGDLGALASQYRLPARTDTSADVEDGNITYVPFELLRLSWLAVRVRNEAGAVLTGICVSLKGPGMPETRKSISRGELAADGSFRFNQIPAGSYEICLPGIDRELWAPQAAPAPGAPVVFADYTPAEATPQGGHKAAAGDCVWSLAVRYGVTEDAIWKFDGNQALARKYANGYTLFPGETVAIPPPRPKTERRATDACHDFVVREQPRNVTVKFVDRGRAAPKGLPATVAINGHPDLVTETDGGGAVRFTVPYGATEARISIPDFGIETYTLKLGHLCPVESPEGVLQRLTNLGYFHEPVTPEPVLPEDSDPVEYAKKTELRKKDVLRRAVRSFQQKYGVSPAEPDPNGTVNRETMDALVKACGA